MEIIRRILRTPGALVVLLAAIIALIGVIIKSISDENIAKLPIRATQTAEARFNRIGDDFLSTVDRHPLTLLATLTSLSPVNTVLETLTQVINLAAHNHSMAAGNSNFDRALSLHVP